MVKPEPNDDMCGIAGQINFERTSFVPENRIRIMMDFMKERGPDASDCWQKDNLALGHTRLSIIDLSIAGNQPMFRHNIVVVFNGEIYNFRSLKERLITCGASFETQTDTEVIIWGYKVWGIAGLLDQLEGMFAFGLYDESTQQFYLARDRFGEKPLYYFNHPERLLFCSDIRAIHHLERDHLSMDLQSIDYYLSELSSPQPKSIWKEIKQVQPAHYLCLDISNKKVEEKAYWTVNSQARVDMDSIELLETVESHLKRAVMSCTVSDVPIGCFLSGGVDSGMIVAMLAEMTNHPIKTFTVGLPFHKENELPEAKMVADRYGTDHQEIILEANLLQDIEGLLAYYGEPFADSSCIPTYYVTKAIGSKVKVALSGDGGDEVFGGYPDYKLAYLTDRYLEQYKNPTFRKFATLIDKVTSRLGPSRENMGSFETYAGMPGNKRLYRQMGFTTEAKSRLYKSDVWKESAHYSDTHLEQLWETNRADSLTDTLMNASLHSRLLNDYLVKVDRASMRNSLEVRVPFLNKTLVEFMFQVNGSVKLQGGHGKYLLKQLAMKYLDKSIMNRPKKGFAIPLEQWLKNDLRFLIGDYLEVSNTITGDLFDPKELRTLISRFLAGGSGLTHQIWSLICLEVWYRTKNRSDAHPLPG